METSRDRATLTDIERTSYVFYDVVRIFTSNIKLLSFDGTESKDLLPASWPGLMFYYRYMYLFLLRQ